MARTLARTEPIAELEALVAEAKNRPDMNGFYFYGGMGCDVAVLSQNDRIVVIDNWTTDYDFHATVGRDWDEMSLAEDPTARHILRPVPAGTPIPEVLDRIMAQINGGYTYAWKPGIWSEAHARFLSADLVA